MGILKNIIAGIYFQSETRATATPTEEQAFCLNCKKTNCAGDCAEFRNFKKALKEKEK